MHPAVDIAASVASYHRQWEDTGISHPIKLSEDLDRYALIIERTRPDLLIETGTYTGESARWFARCGVEVVTIDIGDTAIRAPGVTCLTGSSTDPAIVETVQALADGRRTMVSLDSDHQASHVRQEIDRYGGLVSPGCYLVVEDGICRWIDDTVGPLDAIEQTLALYPGWQRDHEIEALHPITMHVCGWWLRNA